MSRTVWKIASLSGGDAIMGPSAARRSCPSITQCDKPRAEPPLFFRSAVSFLLPSPPLWGRGDGGEGVGPGMPRPLSHVPLSTGTEGEDHSSSSGPGAGPSFDRHSEGNGIVQPGRGRRCEVSQARSRQSVYLVLWSPAPGTILTEWHQAPRSKRSPRPAAPKDIVHLLMGSSP